MRRRALLAASKPSGGGGGTYDEYFGEIPPESTEFGFPLYITVPFYEVGKDFRFYYKDPSDIVSQLVEWLFENAELWEDFFETYYEIYDPDVYVNGDKMTRLYAIESVGTMGVYFATERVSDCGIDSDYSIYMNVRL